MISKEFIRKIPKTDLHLHLSGSVRLPTLIELSKKGNLELPSYEETGMREIVFKPHYNSLSEYLQGFKYTSAILQTPENLERVAFELAEDNLAEGVRYIEIRLSPQRRVSEMMSAETIIRSVVQGVQRAQKRHNESEAVRDGNDLPFEFGIIVCAMRSFDRNMGDYYRSLLNVASRTPKMEVYSFASLALVREAVALRNDHGLPIVGFDLAGEEAGFPAADHVAAYQFAHRHFLKKTVHAGEAYGPESIFQAITECHTDRIGHGTFLFAKKMIQDPTISNPEKYIEGLVDYIGSRRINLEVCITSNLQTSPEIQSVEDHPVGEMLKNRLSVSICTDNRLLCNTSVSRELELLVEHFDISDHLFRSIVIGGFKGNFFGGSYTDKRAYVWKAIDIYDKLAAEMLK